VQFYFLCNNKYYGVYIWETVKMLQGTVHHSLILQKVSINDKDDYKQSRKTITWSSLSIFTYLGHLEFSVTKQLVYLCMQYRSLPLKNSIEGVTDQ